MISVDKAVIARYEKQGLHFEVLVDPDGAQKVRTGQAARLDDIVAAHEVFKDNKKGERSPATDLNKIFGTSDIDTVIMRIIKEGEIQLTTEQKRKMQEEREKQVVALIARNAVDPRTHIPHPPQRIELAIAQAKVHIDGGKSAEEQVDEIIAKLRPIIPIKFETVRVAVKVSAGNATHVYSFLKQKKVEKEEWTNDGSLVAMVSIPAGLQGEFFDKLNKLTSGQNETKIIERL